MEHISTFDQMSRRAPNTPPARRVLNAFFRTPRRILVAVLAVGLIVTIGYIAFGTQTPEQKAAKELAAVVASVSKYMVLPADDQPVLATVTDAEALKKQQAFFTGSINGDQLLIFPKNMKAIIWSPSRGKIINVGPIQQTSTAVAPPAPAVNIQEMMPVSTTPASVPATSKAKKK
jgi:hypothetical protein